jgi:hypothetical protein
MESARAGTDFHQPRSAQFMDRNPSKEELLELAHFPDRQIVCDEALPLPAPPLSTANPFQTRTCSTPSVLDRPNNEHQLEAPRLIAPVPPHCRYDKLSKTELLELARFLGRQVSDIQALPLPASTTSVDPAKPATRPLEPATKPLEPADKPLKPVDNPLKPADELLKAMDKPLEPATKPFEPADKPLEPLDKPLKPVDKPLEPAANPPTPPAARPVRSLAGPANPPKRQKLSPEAFRLSENGCASQCPTPLGDPLEPARMTSANPQAGPALRNGHGANAVRSAESFTGQLILQDSNQDTNHKSYQRCSQTVNQTEIQKTDQNTDQSSYQSTNPLPGVELPFLEELGVPPKWRPFAAFLRAQRRELTERLTDFGLPAPLLAQAEGYVPHDPVKLLDFEDRDPVWLHTDLLPDNILLKRAVPECGCVAGCVEGSVAGSEMDGAFGTRVQGRSKEEGLGNSDMDGGLGGSSQGKREAEGTGLVGNGEARGVGELGAKGMEERGPVSSGRYVGAHILDFADSRTGGFRSATSLKKS